MTYRKINAVTGAWAQCESCSLHETRTKPVFWRGNPEARLMLIGEAPGCVIPGQYVNRRGIPVLIEDVNVIDGEIINTHRGVHHGDVVKITALGVSVSVTPDHMISVRRSSVSITNHSRRVLMNEEWIRSSDVKRGDFLVIKKSEFKPVTEPINSIDISKYEVNKERYRHQSSSNIAITKDCAIALGLFLGDGTSSCRGGVVKWILSSGYKERHVHTVCNFIRQLGLVPTIKVDGKLIIVSAYSTKLARFFGDVFYSRPEGNRGHGESKQVPGFVFCFSIRSISDFMFGWYEADGQHLAKATKGRKISSVSYRAIMQGVWLYLKAGIVPTMSTELSRKENEQIIYGLSIGNDAVRKLGWDIEIYQGKHRVLYQEDADNFYVPVGKVERLPYNGIVYDWTTRSHDYSVPFRIHNSNEDLEGKPFVGRAGALLDSILESIGIEPWDCIIINTIGCRPPENRKPTPLEWRACSPRTYSLIVSVRPAAMVLLGATALTFLYGESKITQWRGKQLAVTIPWRTGDFKVAAVATYHPSYLLRCNDEKVKQAMTNDIRLGLELASKSYLESDK